MFVVEIPGHVDLIIVGSGPVGSAFARCIRDSLPDSTIVMVERGPVITNPPAGHVRNLPLDAQPAAYALSEENFPARLQLFEAGGNEPLIRPRAGTQLVALSPQGADRDHNMPAAIIASNVGGMGSLWTCAVPRPGGTERIPFIPADELETLLSEAERLLAMTANAFPTVPASSVVLKKLGERYNAGRQSSAFVQRMPLACTPSQEGSLPLWSSSSTILGDLLDSTSGEHGFWILSETVATKIILDGDRASGVIAHRIADRSELQIRASTVVIAADALRTPQLLWSSGIGNDALGRYLNDQPQVVCAAHVDGVELSRELDDRARDSLTGVSWVPFDSDTDHPFHCQVMQMEASPIAIGSDPAASDPRPMVGIGVFGTKEIRESDRVWFDTSSPDEFGMPAIRIDYDLTPTDIETVNRASAVAREIAAVVGEIIANGDPIILPAGTSIHYQGSTRMGVSDDGKSVCDSFSRVWGVENLFVGGNGVIPTPTACNPTLTSVALAVRASSRVVELISEATLLQMTAGNEQS